MKQPNISPEGVVFEENFETGGSSWYTNGSWAIGKVNDSLNCAGTNLSGNYPNNAKDLLMSPPISLPVLAYPSSRLKLNFGEWFKTEDGYDSGMLIISTNEGNNWTRLDDDRTGNSNGGR